MTVYRCCEEGKMSVKLLCRHFIRSNNLLQCSYDIVIILLGFKINQIIILIELNKFFQMNLTIGNRLKRNIQRSVVIRLSDNIQTINIAPQIWINLSQETSSRPFDNSQKEITKMCSFFEDCSYQKIEHKKQEKQDSIINVDDRKSSLIYKHARSKSMKISLMKHKKISTYGQFQTVNSLKSYNKFQKSISQAGQQSLAIFSCDSEAYLKNIYEQNIVKNIHRDSDSHFIDNPQLP